MERRRKKLVFKYFMMLKNEICLSEEMSMKIINFRERKNNDLLEICFSVLSLEWKKKLALVKRVEKSILFRRIKVFFQTFHYGLYEKKK
jgi:hypothetical protein